MLKTVMFVSALAISAPSFAQDMQPQGATVDQQAQAAQSSSSDMKKSSKKAKRGKTAQAETASSATPGEATATAAAETPQASGDVSADVAATTPTTAPVDPAQTATQAQPAPATAASVTAQAAPAPAPAEQPVATADANAAATPAGTAVTGSAQIAQVVNTEFPTYDKNKDGNLDKSEFASWMVTLKKASDPATDPAAPATQQWVAGAFASADKDKSSQVSQAELTSFLTQGAG